MFIVLGASGNVGLVVTQALRARGERVLAVTHSAEKATRLAQDGVEVEVVDIRDVGALRGVFRRGRRAFLLNPPGDKRVDSDAEELMTARSITDALKDCGLEKIVVHSTYGTRAGKAIGDLGTLHALEEGALASGIPTAINRAAYYFTNLGMFTEAARSGTITTFYPAELALPMVSADDLGEVGAERLLSGLDDVGIVYVEGPERYTFVDVAEAFAEALGHPVAMETLPRAQWEDAFRSYGFSPESARSYMGMTELTVDGAKDFPKQARRGRVGLREFVERMVQA